MGMRVLCAFVVVAILAAFVFSEDESLTQEERKTVNKFFRLKNKEAEAALKKGDFITARRILQALIVLGTDDLKLRAQIEDLERLVRKEETRANVIDARIVVDKPVFSGVSSIKVFVRLINRSDDTVYIFHKREKIGVGTNCGTVSVLYTAYRADGSIAWAERGNLSFKKSEPLALKKNQMWEKELLLEVPELSKNELVTYIYTLTGSVVLEVLRGDKDVYTLTLDMGRLSFKVVPPGAEKYALDPLNSLTDAVKRAAAKPLESETEETIRAIFFSPFFLSESQKGEAVAILVSWLAQLREDFANASMAALSYLTNLPYGKDRARWVNWWKDVSRNR
jgi:hypothetical protein